jgi:hypothetical protein
VSHPSGQPIADGRLLIVAGRENRLARAEADGSESVIVKRFGCDVLIEANDADAIVGAFVVQGQESHTWSYPNEAIRSYARNYA